jgi:hypothetical protein
MLWEKIHRDSKTGDISHKDNPVVNMPFVTGVAGNLIICIALLLSGCVSKTVEKSYIFEEDKIKPPEFMGVLEPESMGVSEPESLGVSEPESLGVSEPKPLEISEPKSLESGRFPGGKYTPAERENVEYNRCAKLKEFSEQQKCALEALDIKQE